MGSDPPRRFTFSQLSVGLQILLILILIGSCSGASGNSVTNPGVGDDVQQLQQEIVSLKSEVRKLRTAVRLQRLAQ